MSSATPVCWTSRLWWLWLCVLLSSTFAVAAPPPSSAPDEQVDAAENADVDSNDADGEQDDNDDADDVVECHEQDEECDDDDDDDADEASVPDATDRRLRELKTRAFRDASTGDPAAKEDAAFASWFAAPSAACVALPASYAASLLGWTGSLVVGSAVFGGLVAFTDDDDTTLRQPLAALPYAALTVAGQSLFLGAVPLLIVPITAALAGLFLDVSPSGHVGDVFTVAAGAAGVSAVAGALPAMIAVLPLLVFRTPTDSFPFMMASATAGLVVVTATGLGVWWAVRGLHEDTAAATPAERQRVVSTTKPAVSLAADAMPY